MKKIFIIFLKLLAKFIKKDKKLITLIFRGYSGSNLSPIIEELESGEFEDYKINVVWEGKINSSYAAGESVRGKLGIIRHRLKKYMAVLKSQLVITTHGFYKLRDDNKMINLWHGIPLKSMSLMNKAKTDDVDLVKDDYFLSTSDFYNTVMNACLGIRVEKYYIAGYPRNDYLFNQKGIANLERLIERSVKEKVILFMPTYRDLDFKLNMLAVNKDINNMGMERKPVAILEENLFRFKAFDFIKFNAFLEKNNLLFMLKLHPNEEEYYVKKYSKYITDNIILVKGEDLENKKMDLYKIMNAIDLLITDYSSVYFDYLLLDRPIIFTPVDYEEYKEKRGFLLEPYDFWTPGPKCLDQDTLQNEIIKSLSNPNYYKKEREIIKNIFHKYQDGNSTKRVMDLIFDIVEG